MLWEDFIDAMAKTRLQDEYNKAVLGCDIFVMLFFTKLGKYTEEEFEAAFGKFKEKGKPLIYIYFKSAQIDNKKINRNDMNSLWDFQDKLKNLGHFQTEYKSIEDLKYKFSEQLRKVIKVDTPGASDGEKKNALTLESESSGLVSNAIKGLWPFTPEDAELFSRLQRQGKLEQL